MQDKLFPIPGIQTNSIEFINQICEDSNGYLWLATDKGLFVFDGNRLSLYEKIPKDFEGADFQYVFADSHDRIWAGTYELGLLLIDLKTDNVSVFKHLSSNEKSIADNRTKFIWEDFKGRIWIATHTSGLNLFLENGNEFKHFLPSFYFPERNVRDINEMISHRSDTIRRNVEWIGSLDGLLAWDVENLTYKLYECSKGNLKQFDEFNGLENEARSIVFGENKLILGTWGGGLCTVDTASNEWDCFKPEVALPASHIRNNMVKLLWNLEGQLVYSSNGITNSFDINNRKKVKLSSIDINKYFKDSKNQEWYVFNRNLLFVKTNKSKLIQYHEIGKKASVLYYDGNKEQILFGSYNSPSISVIDSKTFDVESIIYHPKSNTGSNFVKSISRDSLGRIVFHDSRDLYTYENGVVDLYLDISKYKKRGVNHFISILSMFIDSHGEIWLGDKSSGILRIDSDEANIYTQEEGISHAGWIGVFFEDSKGRIWFGTEKSIEFFDKSKNSFVNILYEDFSFTNVADILESDSGEIWFIQGKRGLFKVSNINENGYEIENYRLPNLVGKRPILIKVDDEDNIWGYTRKGLFYFNITTQGFFQWGKEYGLSDISSAIFVDDKMLHFCVGKSLNVIDVDSLQASIQSPSIKFNSVKVFNKTFDGIGKSISLVDQIELSYKESFFSLGFSLLDIVEPQSLNFDYKMDGMHESWIPLGGRNYVEFPTMNPGEYQLQIRHPHVQNGFVYSKKLKIVITPPFWKSIWFQLLFFVLLMSLLYLYIGRRRRRTKKMWKDKLEFEHQLANVEMTALKSQMNPHFIFNCLNSIKLYILENDQDKASKYISDFSKLLRLALNNSRIDLISLEKEMEGVRLYIELEKMRFEDRFRYQLKMDDALSDHDYMVPPLLIQPFVENALQHGILPLKGDGKLIVDVKKEGELIVYTILDNGIGRKAAYKMKDNDDAENPSLATSITEERLKLIKTLYGMEASIDIVDLENNGVSQGTKVVIKIPAKV